MRDSLSEKSMSDYVPCCLSTHTVSLKNVVLCGGTYVEGCSLRLGLFTVLVALVATRHFVVLGKGWTWGIGCSGDPRWDGMEAVENGGSDAISTVEVG
jgi:hypothetical protein